MRFPRTVFVVTVALFFLGAVLAPAQEKQEKKETPVIALMGGTLIDGNGGTPVPDAVVLIQGRKILQAGIQCIEHLNEMEDNVLDLMARKGVYNVPTMAVYRDAYKAGQVPPVLIEKRHWSQAMHETLFRKARECKILMGIGTDYNIDMKHYPASYFDELKYFVELGVSPMETIVTATRNGAVILGKADELGTIEAGKLADIQVVNGDPPQVVRRPGEPRDRHCRREGPSVLMVESPLPVPLLMKVIRSCHVQKILKLS